MINITLCSGMDKAYSDHMLTICSILLYVLLELSESHYKDRILGAAILLTALFWKASSGLVYIPLKDFRRIRTSSYDRALRLHMIEDLVEPAPLLT